eukprot:Skav234778  [mRNA]  locus=scaffold2396:468815:469336:- [translate_table: standard]
MSTAPQFRISRAVLCSMFFGQDLLRTSQAAQTAQQAAQSAARDAYVQQTLDFIKRCCQNQANNGGTSCSIDVDRPMYPVNARDAVEVLNQRLQELGFESVSAQLPADQPRKIRILASWRHLQPQRTQTRPGGPQGMIGSCPICYEDQPLVALMPCGHTMCNLALGMKMLEGIS